MKRVFTVGVYDLLHIGHVELFRRAREIGDHLTVAVQSSDVVLKYKPESKLVYSTEERMYMVKSVRYVDRVVEYRDVDQRAMAWCREHGKEVVVLPRTEGISSSWLKERIHSM